MKEETKINFTKNWGGKLDKSRFTTVRWIDKYYPIFKEYPIYLREIHPKPCFLFVAELNWKEFKRIRDFSIKEIIEDIGLPKGMHIDNLNEKEIREYFLKQLEKRYRRKPDWRGEFSVIQKLSLVREDEKN